jgi:8-oxo-dGTP diphosphatase
MVKVTLSSGMLHINAFLRYFCLMVTVELLRPGEVPALLSYVVIAARHRGGWLFVRHRRRGGYEMPAGHPDVDESSEEAAVRELMEETGARDYLIKPLAYYSVDGGSGKQYGRLFYAEVGDLDEIADTAEIERVRVFKRLPRQLSLPEVMTFLFRMAQEHIRCNLC